LREIIDENKQGYFSPPTPVSRAWLSLDQHARMYLCEIICAVCLAVGVKVVPHLFYNAFVCDKHNYIVLVEWLPEKFSLWYQVHLQRWWIPYPKAFVGVSVLTLIGH
jgi:hypothetical protein